MKSNDVVGMVACGFVLCLVWRLLGADQGGEVSSDHEASRVQAGFNYARSQGITLDLRRKTRSLVGLGSYLVNAVGGCNDCHTAPPFIADPYAFLGAPKQVNIPATSQAARSSARLCPVTSRPGRTGSQRA